MLCFSPRVASVALVLLAASACGGSAAPPATAGVGASSPIDAKLRAAIASPERPAAESARDSQRHPVETLEFFGLKDDMTVVELAPGSGWFTAVLAPVLRDHGKFRIAGGDPNGPPESESTKNAKELAGRLAKDPATFGKVESMVVDWKSDAVTLGPDGSADMVLTFRNAHGWIARGIFDKVLAVVHKVLKPGGVFGLTDHRANLGGSIDPKVIDGTGYVPEAYMIEVVQKAGFKLAGKSEVNANPKDTKDYPKGVWTLPPTYRLGDTDHAKYQAIGESDRMTLKFVKE